MIGWRGKVLGPDPNLRPAPTIVMFLHLASISPQHRSAVLTQPRLLPVRRRQIAPTLANIPILLHLQAFKPIMPRTYETAIKESL